MQTFSAEPVANRFADLPLRGFEVAERAQGAPTQLLSGHGDEHCVSFVANNQLANLRALCDATSDDQLWAFDASTGGFQLARDGSLCLDAFGPHAASSLGVYWCHSGANQQFVSRDDGSTGRFCTLDGRHCVRARQPGDAPPPPRPSDLEGATLGNTANADACSAWAERGECSVDSAFMEAVCPHACDNGGEQRRVEELESLKTEL